jgi:hypothetical protein
VRRIYNGIPIRIIVASALMVNWNVYRIPCLSLTVAACLWIHFMLSCYENRADQRTGILGPFYLDPMQSLTWTAISVSSLTRSAAVRRLSLPLFTSLSSADAVLPSCLLEQSTSQLQLDLCCKMSPPQCATCRYHFQQSQQSFSQSMFEQFAEMYERSHTYV